MADNLITTNITAHADFTSLRAQLAAVTAQLVRLQETTAGTNAKLANQIAVMNKSFATTLTSTGQFSQHFVSLSSDVDKFGKNLDRGRLKLNDYYNAWNGHTKKTSTLIRDLAKQQVMLQQAIVQPVGKNAQGHMQYNVMVAKGLDEIKNKMAIARQEAAIMNKVMLDGSTGLINWGKNTQWAGRQLTVGLTVPLVMFGAAAQKAFREADAELVRLTKVYGGLAATSSADLAQVRKDVTATAREIASSYGVAYKETIALAADLAATGQQGNELIAATQQTTRLAVLGEVDRQDAMKATLAIQNAFKQSTDELAQSIDFLNAVENQTSTSLADLTEAIPKAGPVIKSLGGDVKDLALYLTAMKEGGVNASEGANAIKSAMASLINPTKVATAQFMGFGIDLKGIVNNNAGDLTATILELQGALDNLNPLDKSRAIEQLFGKFQFARMSALFENLGKSGSQTLQVMDLMKASVTDLAAISERELKMMTESASGQFKRAWAAVQADLASVGEQFLRISTKVLKVVDAIITFFKNLPGPVKTFLNAIGGLTAIAGPLIMMAGVMGNFIGYVVKGIFHLRQLAKGGQGFKLLTPEIIAADAAAKGLATSFYSDSEATIVLSNAVNTLAESFMNLEAKANAAKVSVQPAVSTVAGGVIMSGTAAGGRVVDKDNPLVGRPYSRDMSHLIPSGMPQMGTIFGTVPGSKPVNIRVGRNPQAYMDGDLPKIPGLTSIGGASTGIVAAEAAKWHAMTAAISMQSQEELAILKKEVMATGTVTSSLSDSYQALLPEFTQITQLAAQETAAIVQQVQQGKLTVEAARAKIIALNQQVESMLAETTRLTAAGMGRTASLSVVPLTTQPVVDPVTGKSNMKEMFHKGSVKEMADRIARALGGVRTSGAGYNIETTKPKFARGGYVPGTGNSDTYHTTAEPGSFVINKKSTQENKPFIDSLLGGTSYYANRGGQTPVVLTPGEAVIPADIAQNDMPLMYQLNGGPGNTSGSGAHLLGGSILSVLRSVTQRGRQYKAKALLEHAGVPIPSLQNSVYPFSHSLNLRTRGGGTASAREFVDTFRSPDAFKLANAVLAKSGLKPITKEQHEAINKYLNDAKRLDPDMMLTEAGFGTHLTRAYQSAGVSKDQLLAIAGKHTMRFSFPGSGTIVERRDSLIRTLQGKYPEGVFTIDPKNNNNIIVKMPGEKPFKIEHEATRSTHLATGGVSYETLRQSIPAGSTSDGKLAYGHLPLDETLLNAGGKVPGRMAQRLFPGGTVFLGMPRNIKQVEAQRAAKTAMVRADQAVKDSRFSKKPVTQYGELLEPTTGRSFPVAGIGGLYSKDGNKVFVKPVLDEKAALAEMRATQIAREVHGLDAPKQKIVVIKDPTDRAGKRKLLALESEYDPRLASTDSNFTNDQYFRQLVASALRGDKDLARGNLSGNVLGDVGPAGVFGAASGLRSYTSAIPSVRDQAMINLLGVKGSGAKKFFAESTHQIPKGMTPDQYHERMLKEIEDALPKLKQTVSRFDLNSEEKDIYQAMIRRLSDARGANWRELHGVHSSVNPTPEKQMTPAAIAKMIAADELKRRQSGHSVSLSDNAFKTPQNGFILGGLIGAITKGKALHRIGAGFGKDSTGGWGVTSLEIGMAEKLFASTGLTKRTQRILYDKLAAELAKEMPYGYTKNAQGHLIKALEPDIMDTVIRSAASSTLSDPLGRKVLSQIDREILRKKFANWESKKDTSITDALKQLIFKLEGREKGGPVNAGQPYIVGEKGPELFVPRNAGGIVPNGYGIGGQIAMTTGAMTAANFLANKVANETVAMIIQQLGFMLPMMLNPMMGGASSKGMIGRGLTKVGLGSMTTPLALSNKNPGEITKFGNALVKAESSGTKFGKMVGKIGFGLTRFNVAAALVVGTLMFAKNRWDANTESMRLNALGYGMTEEAAKKAGLKFRDFNKSLKESVEAAKATREQNQLLYQSMTGSGTPLNITITEFKKLKKTVKDQFADQIKLIDKTSADDQLGLAERLKTQFIGMGMTSEEATKKIYTMYTLSKNFSSDASLYTVSADGFNQIKTAVEAAAAAIKIYNQAVHEGRDGTEQADALTTANAALLNAIEKDQEAALKKAQGDKKAPRFISTADKKELMLKTELETLKQISKEQRYQKTISQATLDELEKTNPTLFEIATLHDTNISLLQKQRLIARGFILDMRGLTAAQTDQVYRFNIGVTQSIEAVARVGFLKKQYDGLDRLKQLQEKYTRAMKGQSAAQQISDRDKLAALQKQIDANNKLADSRIKALDAAKKEGDIAREIAKAQARYEAALATGNTADAQQASLDMQGLQSDLQYEAQVKAIEDATTLKNAPLLKQIELIQKKQQDVADASALAADKLGDLTEQIDKEESAVTALIRSMANYRTAIDLHKEDLAKWKTSPEALGMIAAITSAATAAKVSLKDYPVDPQTGKPGVAAAEGLMAALEASLIKSGLIVNGDIYINNKKLDVGLGTPGAVASPDKIADPSKTTGNGLDKPYKYFTESGKEVSKKEYSSMPVGAASGGLEYVLPILAMQNKEFRDWQAAQSAFFKANGGKGTYLSGELVFNATGNVTRDGKYVGRWYAGLPGGQGKVKSYEIGGKVTGPGTGTSDSIPAYLSNGEYVIKERAVRQYGIDLFDNLNAQKLHKGGPVGHRHGPAEAARLAAAKIPQMSAAPTGAVKAANDSAMNKMYEMNPDYYKNENGEWLKRGGSAPSLWQTFTTGKNWKQMLGGNNQGTGPLMEEFRKGIFMSIMGHGAYDRYNEGKLPAKGEYLSAAVNIALARVGGIQGNALMRTIVEGFGAAKGIPNLGHLLPKGSLPFLSSKPSGFAGLFGAKNAAESILTKPKMSTEILESSSPFNLSNKALKEVLSGMYKRKNITEGDYTYPAYTIGESKDTIAFQGMGEDLSRLQGKVRVVPATPEGLLEEALRMNPGNKEIMSMLENFKANTPGVQENNLLDSLLASISISKKGKLQWLESTDGFAMLLSALSGNKNATNFVKHKTNVFKSARDYWDQAPYSNKPITAEQLALLEQEGIDMSQIPLIHSTKYPIMRDSNGEVFLKPHGDWQVGSETPYARSTIHSTLEAPVATSPMHTGANDKWEGTNSQIITRLSEMFNVNGNPASINPTDTWWHRNPGQPLMMPNAIVTTAFTNVAKYRAELIKRGLITEDGFVPPVISDPKSKEVLKLLKTSYTEAEREWIATLDPHAQQAHSRGQMAGEETKWVNDVAVQEAKRMLGIHTRLPKLSMQQIDGYEQKTIEDISRLLGIRYDVHQSSHAGIYEGGTIELPSSYSKDPFDPKSYPNAFGYGSETKTGKGQRIQPEMLRYLARLGHFKTQIKWNADKVDDWNYFGGTSDAAGGLVPTGSKKKTRLLPRFNSNGEKYNIPKFETGINNVPANMLAMLHKNEAVVPANMNPFNPNANNATMGGGVYNITNNINGYDGNLEQLSSMVTQKTITAIKSLDSRTSKMAGPTMTVGIK